jgi:hypothetical protein
VTLDAGSSARARAITRSYSPLTKRRFMVDARIKSRHWANYTLKQAGLPKKF